MGRPSQRPNPKFTGNSAASNPGVHECISPEYDASPLSLSTKQFEDLIGGMWIDFEKPATQGDRPFEPARVVHLPEAPYVLPGNRTGKGYFLLAVELSPFVFQLLGHPVSAPYH